MVTAFFALICFSKSRPAMFILGRFLQLPTKNQAWCCMKFCRWWSLQQEAANSRPSLLRHMICSHPDIFVFVLHSSTSRQRLVGKDSLSCFPSISFTEKGIQKVSVVSAKSLSETLRETIWQNKSNVTFQVLLLRGRLSPENYVSSARSCIQNRQ